MVISSPCSVCTIPLQSLFPFLIRSPRICYPIPYLYGTYLGLSRCELIRHCPGSCHRSPTREGEPPSRPLRRSISTTSWATISSSVHGPQSLPLALCCSNRRVMTMLGMRACLGFRVKGPGFGVQCSKSRVWSMVQVQAPRSA